MSDAFVDAYYREVRKYLAGRYGEDALKRVFSQPIGAATKKQEEPEDDSVDHATAALVQSSVPAYTNPEMCPKCQLYERIFIQANYVCPACKV